MGASFFDLADVISALMTARILVQFVGQIVALVWARKYHPEIHRPFTMFLYPLPCVIALLGWLYVFGNAGLKYIIYGLLTLVGGGIAFLIMSSKTHSWPFASTQ